MLWGYPYKVAGGLAHGHKVSQSTISIAPASCGLLIDTRARVEDKSKAIIARFDIGEALPFFRERGGQKG